MLASIDLLYTSDVFRITHFKCNCNLCSVSEVEYNKSFCMSLITKGFFEYRTFRRNDEAFSGRVLISKPGFEHTTRHIENQPDITLVCEFKPEFFTELQTVYTKEAGWFLQNNDIHALVLQCSTEAEYLYHHIYTLIVNRKANSLHIDELVFDLLDKVLTGIGNKKTLPVVADKLKVIHLPTVETAKEYILQHFKENISLQQLAKHCHVSPFHFSRIFKSIQQVSPHQYLTGIRLHHAKQLIATTTLPVTDIAYESGFNSAEHFTTAYRQLFKVSPTTHRKQLA